MIEFLLALKWPLIVLQILFSPLLIIMILLQTGKGDDLGSALGGGGSSQSVLGAGGASKFLVRGTVIFAVLFMINSIVLAKIFKEEGSRSVGVTASEPVVPAPIGANVLDVGTPETAPAEAPKENPGAAQPATP